MLKIIQDEGAISRSQKQFIRRFKPFVTEKIPVKIGHQGASFPAKVIWCNRLNIWMASPKISGSKCWHAFGVGKPANGSHVPIACEINFPSSGIDRKIGAAFACDHSGNIFVIHRGKIGGGQKGIGKTLFESRYRGVWAEMDDDDTHATVAVVGDLGSHRFPRQVAQFIHKVLKIKEAAAVAASSQIPIPLDSLHFSEETTGEKYDDLHHDLSRQCDHGLVVRDLAIALKSVGLRAGNDIYRDLFAMDSTNRTAAIFQVNTETHLKRIHEGVTRLVFSSLSLREPCLLILAVPAPLEPALTDRLKGLNIETIVYVWQDDQAVFPDLASFLAP